MFSAFSFVASYKNMKKQREKEDFSPRLLYILAEDAKQMPENVG